MDERNLVEERELIGEASLDADSVKVDADDGGESGVAGRRGADHAVVGAHVVADPVASEVAGGQRRWPAPSR